MRNIYLWLQFYFHKLFTSKYRVNGECKGCGECCKNIVFLIDEEYVSTEEQFEALKKFDKKYRHFEINGRNKKGKKDALIFKCKSLTNENRCSDYAFRSVYCRMYPRITEKIVLGGYETFDSCGYEIAPDKSFGDFLK